MGGSIRLNNVNVLFCGNCAMNYLHESLLAVAKEEHFDENQRLMDFISMLDQNVYFGCADWDIVEELPSIDDIKLFDKLLGKTIEKMRQEKVCRPVTLELFENFKNDLSKWLADK